MDCKYTMNWMVAKITRMEKVEEKDLMERYWVQTGRNQMEIHAVEKALTVGEGKNKNLCVDDEKNCAKLIIFKS